MRALPSDSWQCHGLLWVWPCTASHRVLDAGIRELEPLLHPLRSQAGGTRVMVTQPGRTVSQSLGQEEWPPTVDSSAHPFPPHQ